MDDGQGLTDVDRLEKAWHDERTRLWHSFCTAADFSALGNHNLAIEHCRRYPLDAPSLRAFTTALREGWIIRIGPDQYKKVRARPPG